MPTHVNMVRFPLICQVWRWNEMERVTDNWANPSMIEHWDLSSMLSLELRGCSWSPSRSQMQKEPTVKRGWDWLTTANGNWSCWTLWIWEQKVWTEREERGKCEERIGCEKGHCHYEYLSEIKLYLAEYLRLGDCALRPRSAERKPHCSVSQECERVVFRRIGPWMVIRQCTLHRGGN